MKACVPRERPGRQRCKRASCELHQLGARRAFGLFFSVEAPFFLLFFFSARRQERRNGCQAGGDGGGRAAAACKRTGFWARNARAVYFYASGYF